MLSHIILIDDAKSPLQDLGNQAKNVKDKMLKYCKNTPIIYCSGHYHHSLSNNSITQEENSNLYYVDSPSLALDGTGFVISVSNEKITIKGYDFGNNKNTSVQKEINIKSESFFAKVWQFIVRYILFGWLID